MYYGYVQEGDKYAVLMDEEDLLRLVAVLGNQSTASAAKTLLGSSYTELNSLLERKYGREMPANAKYVQCGEVTCWYLKER